MRVDEAFPSTYLKASDLNGKDVKVTIKTYDMAEIKSRSGKTEKKPELHFRGTEKTLLLNKTNANKIAAVLGSDDLDDWIGKTISLYPTVTEFGGEEVECIRIRATSSEYAQAKQRNSIASKELTEKMAKKAPLPAEVEDPAAGMDDDIPF